MLRRSQSESAVIRPPSGAADSSGARTPFMTTRGGTTSRSASSRAPSISSSETDGPSTRYYRFNQGHSLDLNMGLFTTQSICQLQNCTIISIAKPVTPGAKVINGVVTAQGRNLSEENTGYSFVNCFIGGTGRIWLGRAWRPFARVLYAYTFMTDIIASEGWNDFNSPDRDQ